MLSGWIKYSDGTYSMGSKGDNSEDWKTCDYYAGDDGALVKNSLQEISVYDGSTRASYNFYFNSTGKKYKLTDSDAAQGYSYTTKTIGNTEYTFAADGHIMTSDEIEASDETASETTSKSGFYWNATEQKKYYRTASGETYKNQIKSINGNKYLFDGDGSILAGLYYLEFADDGSTITSKVCLNGEDCTEALLDKYTTIDGENYKFSENESKSGVYYFKEPLSTAAEMVTGSTTVEVDGDNYSFKFATSGTKGKGLNGISGSYYYVNGRRVKADSDQKYELFECVIDGGKVTVLTSGRKKALNIVSDRTTNYALISSSGTIVKSGSKKDGDDYKITVKDYKVTEIKNATGAPVWKYTDASSSTSSPDPGHVDYATAPDPGESYSSAGKTFDYDTDASTIVQSELFTSLESSSNITYKFGYDMNTKVDWPTTTTPLKVGTYYAWAIIPASENNLSGATITASFNVTGQNISKADVTAENVTTTYTGEEQEIKVSVNTDKITGMTGKKVTYSLTEDGVYTDSLSFTDATDGAQPVYYKITSDNYNEYIGTAEVTVNPIVASFDWDNVSSISCTKIVDITATVRNAIEGDDFDITYDHTLDSTGKRLIVTVKSLGNSNYALPTHAHDNQKLVSVTHTDTDSDNKCDYCGTSLVTYSSGSSSKTQTVTEEQKQAEIEKAEAEKKAAEIAEVKATTAGLDSMKARSSKTSKGNVKVVAKLSDTEKAQVAKFTELGYTVKYRFYRSTKKSSGYKAMLTGTTGTYTNTVGKSGTRYYYKVQLRVYDKDGKLIAKTALKDCKYGSRRFG